jgi:hypothetical protein
MMNKKKTGLVADFGPCVFGMAFLIASGTFSSAAQLSGAAKVASQQGVSVLAGPSEPSKLGSPYIPVDSRMYPAMLRFYSLGYVDTVFLGLRPWTRASVMQMLEEAGNLIEGSEDGVDPAAQEARATYRVLNRELHDDMEGPCGPRQGGARIELV